MDMENIIYRVRVMELYLDTIQNAMMIDPELVKQDENIKNMFRDLINYYENGQWLEDFMADERGELPSNLKRGVLSEDAVYNLISDVENLMP